MGRIWADTDLHGSELFSVLHHEALSTARLCNTAIAHVKPEELSPGATRGASRICEGSRTGPCFVQIGSHGESEDAKVATDDDSNP